MDLHFKHWFQGNKLSPAALSCITDAVVTWGPAHFFSAFLPQEMSGSKIWIYSRNWYYISEDLGWIICSFTLLLLSQYQSNCSPLGTAWEQLVEKIQTYLDIMDNQNSKLFHWCNFHAHLCEWWNEKNLLTKIVWACDGQHPSIRVSDI